MLPVRRVAFCAVGGWGATGRVLAGTPELASSLDGAPQFLTGALLAAAGVMAGFLIAQWRNRRRLAAQTGGLLLQERERIARDLHDDVGAQLTGLALQVDLVRRKSFAASFDHDLESISRQTRQLADHLRETVWALNPACDTFASFASHLAEQAERWQEQTGLDCRVDLPAHLPEFPLCAEARHHLALVVREAFANVVKHSGSTRAALKLELVQESLRLRIQDAGRGFDPEIARTASGGMSGNGLGNQRARVESLGGTWELQSQPGQGTTLIVTVPLAALRAAAATR